MYISYLICIYLYICMDVWMYVCMHACIFYVRFVAIEEENEEGGRGGRGGRRGGGFLGCDAASAAQVTLFER
jgi:uncharacterized membrane protein YgcG